MSFARHYFAVRLKSDLVLSCLKGQKDLNTLTAENALYTNLIRN